MSEIELAKTKGVAALYASRENAQRARANWMARPLWRKIGDVIFARSRRFRVTGDRSARRCTALPLAQQSGPGAQRRTRIESPIASDERPFTTLSGLRVTDSYRAINTVAIIGPTVVQFGSNQQLITTATMCVRFLNWNDTSGNL